MKIAFLGDIAFIGKYDLENSDITRIEQRFSNVKAKLDVCDFVIANLESPFTKIKTTKEAKTLPLRTDVRNVDLLKYLGVSDVSLANNHFFDYGVAGAMECLDTLNKAGIGYFGINNKVCTLQKGSDVITIGGFCCRTTNAWHYGDETSEKLSLNSFSFNSINKFLNDSNNIDAYPFVFVHWGEENTHYPKKEHIEFADCFLEKTAATIIGHHPHVMQGVKSYPKGKAFFSLGNFCFDDCISSTKSNVSVKQTTDNLKGYFVIVDIEEGNLISYELIPYEDKEMQITINYDLLTEIKRYSDNIVNVEDWYLYEERRKFEQKNAAMSRLAKKDIKWLLGHMNFVSVMAVLQRKKNQKIFSIETQKLHDHYFLLENKQYISSAKKILYIGNFDRPDKSAAGKRVYGIAKVLESLGYTVFLLGKERSFVEKVQYSTNIYYYSLPKFSLINSKKYIRWISQFIKDKNINPCLVMRYGSPALATFDFHLNKWCKRRNIPIIADVVDWLSADTNNLIFNFFKNIDTFFEKAIFNKQSDGIIVISAFLMNYYKKYNDKLLVIPPLVEPNQSVNEFYGESNKEINIAYAGSPFRKGKIVKNVHNIKDRLDLVVEAIYDLRANAVEVYLHIYGLSKEEYLIAFPKHREYINNNYIIFYGLCSMEVVKNAIKRMDYTVLLREKKRSTMAGFPTKVVESMSLGIPVITTKTSDLEEYIEDGKNGFFVDIGDKEQLVNQLTTIMKISSINRQKIKRKCYDNHSFIYSHYKSNIGDFLNKFME